MHVRLWGTRGSLASPGPDTLRYGGNTSCVEVTSDDVRLVLDAGTGIRALGRSLGDFTGRVDILLTHLHLDHLQGIGFFGPIFRAGVEVHIWGPPSSTMDLRERLARYLSPPLFPVRLRDLGQRVSLHDVPAGEFRIGEVRVVGEPIIHPGPTVGYRISAGGVTLAYLPDHEPALGAPRFPLAPRWTSGEALADGADLLIHDVQYTSAEYPAHVGWGHSSEQHAWALAHQAGARRLVTFHHDPGHSDDQLDAMVRALADRGGPEVIGGTEGLELDVA
ncbi:MAG TPA: MBL fold metallo-hydrolase [Candidatus Limnocylindria bacterium]